MTDQLLTIKLFAPPLRPGLVSRPQLIQKLNLSLQQGSRLTLFSAPAGYGKTTLALEWLAELNRPCAWLSLDRTDNHPVQFLSYLTAALQKLAEKDAHLFPFPFKPFQVESSNEVSQKLVTFVNQIANVTAPFVFVLDDYHTISDLAVHQMVEFIIDHQPPQMHLVITTRQDPLLPLSKLRSRGQVTEIRLGDLRFTPEEAAAFLNGTMGLDLIAEQIDSLEARTEGWIAGLQLAALSLSDGSFITPIASSRQEVAEFIQNFAGDDRHIMDYLLDEVLSRQPEEVQYFLLRTSILKRLCGPLCDAVLDQASQKAAASSHTILDHLERANLFIIPLDNRRQWYRYHHLFADLLSSRLQSSNADLVPQLHHQASLWCEQEGLVTDAVDHALLAEDFDRALGLIEHAARTSIWASGDLPALLNWSKRLPEDVLMTRPRLCIYNARALFFIGHIEAAKNYLQSAENALPAAFRAREKPDKLQDELWGLFCTNKATFAAMQGNLRTALAVADQARELVPITDLSSHARIAHAVGVAQYYLGNVQGARQTFARAVQLCRQANNRNLGLDVIACLAMTEILAGQIKEAHRICEEAFAMDSTIRQAPPATAIYLALAEILYEENDLTGASEALETCIRLGEKQSWQHVLWQAYALQSRIYQAQQNRTAAINSIHQAEQIARRYHNPHIDRKLRAYRARIELTLGDRDFAEQWAETYLRQAPYEGWCDFEEITLAGVWLGNHRNQEALVILDRLLDQAQKAGRGQTVLYALAIKGHISGPEDRSETLNDAYALAERENFQRVFLEVNALLPPSLRSPLPGRQRAGNQTNLSPFIQPLSDRELEVLRFIAQGLTNPEIATRLYLSVNTLRAHAANIYQKLDVHNRTEAVTRARQLGLLKDQ